MSDVERIYAKFGAGTTVVEQLVSPVKLVGVQYVADPGDGSEHDITFAMGTDEAEKHAQNILERVKDVRALNEEQEVSEE